MEFTVKLSDGMSAQVIGDGTLLDLIKKWGPFIFQLLVAFGLIKLPPGVTLPPFPANAGSGNVSDKP